MLIVDIESNHEQILIFKACGVHNRPTRTAIKCPRDDLILHVVTQQLQRSPVGRYSTGYSLWRKHSIIKQRMGNISDLLLLVCGKEKKTLLMEKETEHKVNLFSPHYVFILP